MEHFVEEGTQGLHFCRVEAREDEPPADRASANKLEQLHRGTTTLAERIIGPVRVRGQGALMRGRRVTADCMEAVHIPQRVVRRSYGWKSGCYDPFQTTEKKLGKSEPISSNCLKWPLAPLGTRRDPVELLHVRVNEIVAHNRAVYLGRLLRPSRKGSQLTSLGVVHFQLSHTIVDLYEVVKLESRRSWNAKLSSARPS